MSRLPSGSKISALLATVVIVGFFMPWVSVSCIGSEMVTFSGYQIAAGGDVPTVWGPVDMGSGSPVLFLTPLAAIVILVIFYVGVVRGRIGVPAAITQMVLAASGLLSVLVVVAQVRADFDLGPDALIQFGVRTLYGFLATVFGLIGVIVGGLLAIPDILRGGDGSDDEDDFFGGSPWD